MPRVYPNAVVVAPTPTPTQVLKPIISDRQVQVLTVWKKSLLFNCKGFTVFDSKGNLMFRVDNYLSATKAEIVLMDATGKPLLTIRRKKLRLADNWMVFDGETEVNPLYSVKRPVSFMNSKVLAPVTAAGCNKGSNRNVVYQIEGSYRQRCCTVLDEKRRAVADIKRKESVGGVSFGVDVFRLVVQPEMDPTVAMALVMLLE